MRTSILVILLLLTTTACEAQQVYSWGIYSMGETIEHDWKVGRGMLSFGLEQYLQQQDDQGRDVVYPTGRSVRFTRVFLGPAQFRLRGTAWLAAALLGVALLAPLYALCWLFRRNSHAPTKKNPGDPSLY